MTNDNINTLHIHDFDEKGLREQDAARSEFARQWLYASGWDGKSAKQAQKLSEGYAIRDLPCGGFAADRVYDIAAEALKDKENTLPTVNVTSDADTEEVQAEVPKTELEKLVILIDERHPDWHIEKAWDGVFLKDKDGKVVCQVDKNFKNGLLEGYDYSRKNEVTDPMTAEEALRWMEETDLKEDMREFLKGDGKSLEDRT